MRGRKTLSKASSLIEHNCPSLEKQLLTASYLHYTAAVLKRWIWHRRRPRVEPGAFECLKDMMVQSKKS